MDLSAVSSHSRTLKECNWNNSNRRTFEGAPWLHDCHQSSNKSSDWNLRLPRWPKSANMGRTNSLFWITKTFVCWWCVPSLDFHLKSLPPTSVQAFYDCLTLKSRDHDLRGVLEEQLSNHWAGLWTSTTCYPPNTRVCVWCVSLSYHPCWEMGKSNSIHPGEWRRTFKT